MAARVGNSDFDVLDFLGTPRWECAESRNDPQHCQESLMHKTPLFSITANKQERNSAQEM
jgi:hypothetical protein